MSTCHDYLYQKLIYKIQKLLHLLWFVLQTPTGALPEDLAPSAEPYYFSNLAGACVHCLITLYPFVLDSWKPGCEAK